MNSSRQSLRLPTEYANRVADRLRYRLADRRVKATAIALTIAAIPVILTLWDYRAAPLRTAFPTRMFSQFFDIQARAFLDGHLDVPRGSLGIEGFIHNGREYLYYGPFPSILRMPIVAVTNRFYAELTAPSSLSRGPLPHRSRAPWCGGSATWWPWTGSSPRPRS